MVQYFHSLYLNNENLKFNKQIMDQVWGFSTMETAKFTSFIDNKNSMAHSLSENAGGWYNIREATNIHTYRIQQLC